MGHYSKQEEEKALCEMYNQYKIADPYFLTITESSKIIESSKRDDILGRAWDAGVEVPSEMFDFINVMIASANSGKYAPNNWLKKEGAINSDHKKMHESMFRHLAESQCGNRQDKDTGMDPLLHLATRALMMYVRIKREL